MASAGPPRGSLLARAAVGAYVAIQLVLPVPSWLAGLHQTEGYFSWNMYAHHYTCEWAYESVNPGGEHSFFDPRRVVHDPKSVTHFFHRDALPALHAWACREVVEPGGQLVGRVRCALRPDEAVELVQTGVDLCRATNGGVLP
jgi:hypothetical protein